MSLRALKTLLAIAERGSFAAAAKACHLTESAVSMQMKALEADFGVQLFDRSVRPPVLTGQAEALLDHARQALAAYDAMLAQLRNEPDVTGTLRLGAVPSIMSGLLPRALAALSRQHPGIHVTITMGLSAELVERVTANRLDAAVVSELKRPPRGLGWQPFLEEPLMLAVPRDAPREDAVQLLLRYPFIRYTRQAWVGGLIDDLLKSRRLKVREAMTLDTLEAVTAMVHHGLGVSIIPVQTAAVAEGATVAHQIRTVALPGPSVHRTVGLLHRSGGPAERLAMTLLGQLQQLVAAPPKRVTARRR